MGAKDSQLKPYLSFYHALGIDTLSHAVGPRQVLQPQSAMDHMAHVLQHVSTNAATKDKDLIFHSFSMGGYLYGLMLHLLKEDPRFADVSNKIRFVVGYNIRSFQLKYNLQGPFD